MKRFTSQSLIDCATAKQRKNIVSDPFYQVKQMLLAASDYDEIDHNKIKDNTISSLKKNVDDKGYCFGTYFAESDDGDLCEIRILFFFEDEEYKMFFLNEGEYVVKPLDEKMIELGRTITSAEDATDFIRNYFNGAQGDISMWYAGSYCHIPVTLDDCNGKYPCRWSFNLWELKLTDTDE